MTFALPFVNWQTSPTELYSLLKFSVGSYKLEGSVERVDCEPYEYVDKDSGEIIVLDYRWIYLKPGDTVEEAVKAEQHQEEPELV